jgi:hypothetical protein
MAIQYSTKVRTAKQAAIEPEIGVSPIIEFWTGAKPATPALAATGTLLAQFALPVDWLAAAAAGAVGKTGTWQGNALAGIATANIGYFRICRSGSPTECDMQGSVTATGGGGDMTVDNISLAALQQITITGFTLTDNNA